MDHGKPRKTSVEVEMAKARALFVAAVQSAKELGLGSAELAHILGIPEGAMRNLGEGTRFLSGTSGEAEQADALVRIVVDLKALLGDEQAKLRSWIRTMHDRLGAKPIELMQRKGGVLTVRDFLERTT